MRRSPTSPTPDPAEAAARERPHDGTDRANAPSGAQVFPATIAVYHGPLYAGPSGFESYGPYARYVSAFARHFRRVVVFGPAAHRDTEYRGCTIEAPNVEVVPLPDFRTHVQAMRHASTIYRSFRRHIDGIDVVNCRHVAPFGFLLYWLARRRGIPFFYHFTSDPWEILRVTARYRGPYGWIARSAYALDFAIQRYILRRTYAFVNGRLPYERLRRISERTEPIISSSLTATDFRAPSGAALHRPIRLLYVGYLKHMKGLDHLLEAVRQVLIRGPDVELHLVGTGPEETALKDEARRLGVENRVHWHGYVPMGDALNRHYNEADVFVFPSLSEGSPRVVLEALAHGLPTISTGVGSVPELIGDGVSGLIVPPRDAAALADAIVRFVQDDALRARCAVAGFEAVQGHTVDRYVGRIAEKAKALVRERPARS